MVNTELYIIFYYKRLLNYVNSLYIYTMSAFISKTRICYLIKL